MFHRCLFSHDVRARSEHSREPSSSQNILALSTRCARSFASFSSPRWYAKDFCHLVFVLLRVRKFRGNSSVRIFFHNSSRGGGKEKERRKGKRGRKNATTLGDRATRFEITVIPFISIRFPAILAQQPSTFILISRTPLFACEVGRRSRCTERS